MKIVIDLDDDIVGADGFKSVDELESAVRSAVSALETEDGDTIYLGSFSVHTQNNCVEKP